MSVLTGLMGSGKTCLLSRIFNQPPPSVYTSTGVAEQSRRGWLHHMGSMSSSSWQPFSHEDTREFLASNVYQCFASPDMVHGIPISTAPLPLPAPSTVSSSVAPTPSTAMAMPTSSAPTQTAVSVPTPGASLSPQVASQRVTSMPLQPANHDVSSALPRKSMSPKTSSQTAASRPLLTASSELSSTLPSGTPHPQTAAAMATNKASMPAPMTSTILDSAPSSVAIPRLETATSTPGAFLSPQAASQRATAMPLQPANPEISSALPRTSMSLETSSQKSASRPLLTASSELSSSGTPHPQTAAAMRPTNASMPAPMTSTLLDSVPYSVAIPHLETASLSSQAASQRATAMPLQTASPEISSALPRTSMSPQASSHTAADIPLDQALPSSPPSGMPHLQMAAARPLQTASLVISSALPSGMPHPRITTSIPANLDLVSATPHLETATALPAPIAYQPLIASFQLSKSSTSQLMMRLVKLPKDVDSSSRLDLAHFTDTGGQPEYMESVPSLIHHCHLGMLTVNLKFDVDEYPPVHYHEDGKKYKRALPSQFSNRQIIQKLASTLQAKRFAQREGQCFRLLVVATHRDCVPWHVRLSSRVKAYHKALCEIFLPACEKELIRFSANKIPFVLNLKEPDSTDLEKLDLIRQRINESGVGEVIKTPVAFLIFEQELMEFAEKATRSIVNLDECFQVGERLKMSPDMVRSALIFFHRQITFLYYHHVMPNLVFTRPQVPLDCMNAIVQFKYKLESGELMGVTEELATSVRDGIITEEILSHKQLSKCFVPGLYEPRHAIDLLFHTFTVAPLSHESQHKTGSSPAVQTKPSTPFKREKKKYLMMCLRQAIPDKNLSRYIPASKIAPLVVQFTKNCVPLSCFGRTISCLLAMYDWKLSRADNGSPKHLASNFVSLFDSQLPVEILLRDATSHLEIHVLPDKGFTPDRFPEVFFQIRETVFSAIKQVFDRMQLTGIEITLAFVCPCSKSLKHSHVASLHTLSGSSDGFLRCSKTGKNTGAVQKKYQLWFDTPDTEKYKPSLPKLLQFKVPQKVGTNCLKFGIFLLNDEDGSQIQIIDNDCNGKSERIMCKILSDWLQGKGKPVTWKELIETLRDCDLNELADTIQEKTQ